MKADQAGPQDRGNTGGAWSMEIAEAEGRPAPSLQAVLESPGCPPLLCKTLTRALSWQTRNRRQAQRAVVSPSIAPQWSAALLALGATVTVEGEGGKTEIPLEALLERRVEGEVTALHVKTEGVRWGMAHVGRTPADEPIIAAVAAVEMEGGIVHQACIALTGAWPRPVGLASAASQLVGRPLDSAQIQAVAEAVQQEVMPKGDFRGSEEYRRAMTGVLSRRALEQCLKQEDNDE
jgi:carbon-monoxide dehydrogenase medium subunit